MRRLITLVLAAATSVVLAFGQADESKKEYFANLDSVMNLAETDFQAAMEMCNDIQQKWGLASDLMYCKGVCYIYQEDYISAAKQFSSGISSWKKDDYYRIGAYYRAIASILIEAGDTDNAIKYLSKGIKADKKYYTLYYMRGECYQTLAEYKKAISDYKKAALDEDLFCDAKADIAFCHANMGQFKEGRKAIQESLERDKYHAETIRLRSLFALSENNVEGFIDDYMLYMQINKPTTAAYLFKICKEIKYYDYAKHFAAEILDSQSDSIDIAYWEWVASMIEISQGNETEMWKHAQRAREMNPGIEKLDTEILYQYATHYSVNDDMDNLLVTLDTLIARDDRENDGGNSALQTARGRVLQKLKRYSEAAASFESALKQFGVDPDQKNVLYFKLANLYHEELKDADKAIAYYDSIISIDPKATTIIYQKGKIYSKMLKDTVKANEMYGQIIETEKDMELSSLTMSQFALAQMGKYDEAEAMQKRLDEFAKSAENKAGMAYNAACLYSIIDKKDLAIEKLMEAMDAGELDCQQMKDDEDFDNIRETDEYKAIEKMICLAEEE